VLDSEQEKQRIPELISELDKLKRYIIDNPQDELLASGDGKYVTTRIDLLVKNLRILESDPTLRGDIG